MKKLILLTTCLCFLSASAQVKLPETKTVDSTDTYFGVTYKDPYRWLEHIKDSSVVNWFKQEATYSKFVLNNISGRDELIAEWKKLDKLQPPQINDRTYMKGRIFYRKTMPGQSVGKLYYREGLSGKEQLLFDPLTYSKGKTLSIQNFVPSFDAKYVAISYTEGGAEVGTIKIMDVSTKKFLKDKLYPTAGVQGWSFDNKSVLYMWLKSADNKDPQARLNPKTKLHALGAESKADIDFFSNASYPELKIEPKAYPYVYVTNDNKNYVFSGIGTVQPEFEMYYAPISQFHSGKIQWKVFCTPKNKLVRGLELVGDKAYDITYDGAKNYKLLSTDLKNVDWENAKVIAEEKSDLTLEYITHCKDYLFMVYSDGINNHISKYNLTPGKISEVKLPFTGTAGLFCVNNKTNDCTVGITSWNKPYTEFDFNANTEVFTPGVFNKAPVYPDAYKNLEVKEVEVKGHDGVMIPLSIVYKKGTKLDGNNVCLMDSYGAYGYSMVPYFDYRTNALAVKGVVVAFPHVRGGSERGETWYRAGYKTTKPNTWKDFNSCAEYMIAQGYTNPSKLAGTGTSAGGILISRAITERPDLYNAAICNVGCANAMRLEFSANGPVNIPEFGTVKDSVECKALYEMDGMQHVIYGTKYPAVICVTGWNDPRVVPWEPGKFAAALQNASASGKPVILKVNYDDGHFTEDKNVTFANFADQFAFVLWQCGHPDFQLKSERSASVNK
ncbi:MAG: prolyl oligopeptidase family serine peptidase [Mucilaginibacter sp.]|nr:prolyl oligopeptidase family serine peptidase [Mucilaginibacter sp.]